MLCSRFELAASGIDDALQGLSGDPSGAALPIASGLRVPTFRPDNVTRYLFLLSTRVCSTPFRIRGIRTAYTIGANLATGPGGEGGGGTRNVELPVSTLGWSPPGGNVSFHLVSEPNPREANGRPATDNNSLSFQYSLSPGLIYETIGWSAPQTAYYWQNLNAYTPPAPADWRPLGGLGSIRDNRFPYDTAQAWSSLDIPVDAASTRRVSLYASVLQTVGLGPSTVIRGLSSLTTGYPIPEEVFGAANATFTGNPITYIWRVLGSMITEDCP